MRVYLDNCCFNRPYDDQSNLKVSLETQAKIHIQRLIRNNKIELAASYMLLFENEQNPHIERKKNISRFLRSNVKVMIDHNMADKVMETAAPIMDTGVKAKDAIHVASAIVAQCECFLTTDIRLLKYKDNRIRMMNPLEFIALSEEDENYE